MWWNTAELGYKLNTEVVISIKFFNKFLMAAVFETCDKKKTFYSLHNFVTGS